MTTSRRFPRMPLILAFSAVGVALAVASAGALTGYATPEPSGTMVVSRDLRFADGQDGSVIVTDVRDGKPVEVFTGENGFVRGTLRGLARTRRAEGIGAQDPFRLVAWSDGRLTLDDLTTGRHIELQAFGSVNTEVFGKLLTAHAAGAAQ